MLDCPFPFHQGVTTRRKKNSGWFFKIQSLPNLLLQCPNLHRCVCGGMGDGCVCVCVCVGVGGWLDVGLYGCGCYQNIVYQGNLIQYCCTLSVL